MRKTVTRTRAAPVPLSPISQATCIRGLIFTSGQLGRDPATGKLAGPGMTAQARQALENLRAVIEAAGGSLETVLRIDCYVTDLDLVPEFNVVFGEYFPAEPPARVCVEVQRLAAGALIEVLAIASVEQ
ncbi:MAG: RidA family protein [Firmicutes bacterium]|nr:RidA family protein [Bacillota bacterium]